MIDLEQLKWLYREWRYWDINDEVMTDTKELCETNPKLIKSIENSINTYSIV